MQPRTATMHARPVSRLSMLWVDGRVLTWRVTRRGLTNCCEWERSSFTLWLMKAFLKRLKIELAVSRTPCIHTRLAPCSEWPPDSTPSPGVLACLYLAVSCDNALRPAQRLWTNGSMPQLACGFHAVLRTGLFQLQVRACLLNCATNPHPQPGDSLCKMLHDALVASWARDVLACMLLHRLQSMGMSSMR